MIKVTRTKPGTVECVYGSYENPTEVTVRYGKGITDIMNLVGIAVPHNVKPGDKGTLEFYSGPGFGCWFFVKE